MDTSIFFTMADVADIASVSKRTVEAWAKTGKLCFKPHSSAPEPVCGLKELRAFPPCQGLFQEGGRRAPARPTRRLRSVELFAGAGGLALGLEKAGFEAVLLNEIGRDACATLKGNRPGWRIVEADIAELAFTDLRDTIDLLSGGFPCQAFSYAGKKMGFEDTRGTLFHQFARALDEIRPRVFLAENVRGLLTHDQGRTLTTIKGVIAELGYQVFEPRILKAVFHGVPQKRERMFLVGYRGDLTADGGFHWPAPIPRIFKLRDALKAGDLYPGDCPASEGQKYSENKRRVMEMVPPGGYWRDLPMNTRKEYMKGSFHLGGGKTGIARRLSWDEPSLTLTCSPAQKQTDRCHPEETRPLTTREYARVQTFPDEWRFEGRLSSVYRQIGNAVPVNLAYAVGLSLVDFLNRLEDIPGRPEVGKKDAITYSQDALSLLELSISQEIFDSEF